MNIVIEKHDKRSVCMNNLFICLEIKNIIHNSMNREKKISKNQSGGNYNRNIRTTKPINDIKAS